MFKIEAGKTNLNLTEERVADIIDGAQTIIRPQIRWRSRSRSLR